MIIPRTPLLVAVAVALLLAIVAIYAPTLLVVWHYYVVSLLVLAIIDGLWAGLAKLPITVSRIVPQTVPLGHAQKITLRLTTNDQPGLFQRQRYSGMITDLHPGEFRATGLPAAFQLSVGQWTELYYMLDIVQRGAYTFPGILLRLTSPCRLWFKSYTLPIRHEMHVYPDFVRAAQYTLLATENRLSQMGVLQRQRRGEGMEFLQLRDYRREDPLRAIDWKASMRVRRLISREYQDERDQQIIFMQDCGQRMQAKDGALSHFDHSLNALLLLAWVALRQGDAVGFINFAHNDPRWLPPKKSVQAVSNLLRHVYDLQPGPQFPDYLGAAERLMHYAHKRALVIIVTNLRDEDDGTLMPAIQLLKRRHAVLIANLAEPALRQILQAEINDFDQALTRAAALEYQHRRHIQTRKLHRAGADILNVEASHLSVALINAYWARKRSGVS